MKFKSFTKLRLVWNINKWILFHSFHRHAYLLDPSGPSSQAHIQIFSQTTSQMVNLKISLKLTQMIDLIKMVQIERIIPTPFASHAFHPIDGFSQSFPYHLYVFLFPIHKVEYLALFIFVNIWTVSIHDADYKVWGFLKPLINGSAHHIGN